MDKKTGLRKSLYEKHNILVTELNMVLAHDVGEWPAIKGKGVRIDKSGNILENTVYQLTYLLGSAYVESVFNTELEEWIYVVKEDARKNTLASMCSFKSVDRIRIWDTQTNSVSGVPAFAYFS